MSLFEGWGCFAVTSWDTFNEPLPHDWQLAALQDVTDCQNAGQFAFYDLFYGKGNVA